MNIANSLSSMHKNKTKTMNVCRTNYNILADYTLEDCSYNKYDFMRFKNTLCATLEDCCIYIPPLSRIENKPINIREQYTTKLSLYKNTVVYKGGGEYNVFI